MKELLRKVVDTPTRALAMVAGLAVVLTMLQISLDVLSRILFGKPIPGTISMVSSFYMVAIVFLPLALSERSKAHISVEILWDLYPRPVRYWLAIITGVLTIAVFAVLMVSSLSKAWVSFRTGSVLLDDVTLPVWIAHFLVPIGAAGMVLAAAGNLVANIVSGPDDPDASS